MNPDKVYVLYATDRLALQTDGGLRYANGQRGHETSFGNYIVTLAPGRDPGTDGRSSVTAVSPEADTSWAARTQGQAVLLFVHGYNTSFEDAIKKAAEVKADMPWEGPIVAFSWPSYGDVIDYTGDEDMYQESIPGFLHTLNVLQVYARICPLS
ncbi:hypothetical protein CVIRNUC_003847 [Coccomyxa viridis]|uniref:Alpha/beta hydrolase n=1 Tax=Coccomyxa viridis TaxID=1274662 RepID=A0AAV1I307_9CHLO|nr:hypothetical protein CVIRNUC_003847 [Coccomyxa viridis]